MSFPFSVAMATFSIVPLRTINAAFNDECSNSYPMGFGLIGLSL
jgi:hypothetical protein